MKGKKRFISKLFIILFVIILTVVAVVISSKIIFNNSQNEQEMISSYETKKEKCELLKDIASESIQEEIGIDTRKISNEEIQYRIYNDNESIIFYYYLQDDSTTEHRYNATITLSNEYRILREEYSIEIESFDEYAKSYTRENRVLSIIYGILLVLCLYLLILLLVMVISSLLKICMNKRKKKLVNNNLLGGKDTMSFLGQRYLIHGWRENEHVLTAKELHERVMKDSESYYNWIAPARELVRVCKKTSFPVEYALDIKIAILNCFANQRATCGGDRYYTDPEDEEAVQYCYNSLYGIDKEEAISARKKYLTEMIKTASHVRVFDSHYHSGPTYRNLCEDWIKSKFEEYISRENIDFKQLVEVLRGNFAEVIKTAESNGDFEEDDKKDKESRKMFYDRLKDL